MERGFRRYALIWEVMCLALAGLLFFAPQNAISGATSQLLEDIIRKASKVSARTPLKHTDELLRTLKNTGAARETIEAELRRAGKVLDRPQVAKKTDLVEKEVAAILRGMTKGSEEALSHSVRSLNAAEKEAAVILFRGGERLAEAVPDLAARGRLLEAGGANLVGAVGLHGKDAARAATRLDVAIKNGSLVVPPGHRVVTLADFGAAMTRFGEGSWKFWNSYVAPHWKAWLTTGALAAYLAAPEQFQNKLGQLTEEGARRLTELGGEVLASALRGVGKGADRATGRIGEAVEETFFSGWKKALYSVFFVLAFLIFGFLFLPRLRYHLLRPLRWLMKAPR